MPEISDRDSVTKLPKHTRAQDFINRRRRVKGILTAIRCWPSGSYRSPWICKCYTKESLVGSQYKIKICHQSYYNRPSTPSNKHSSWLRWGKHKYLWEELAKSTDFRTIKWKSILSIKSKQWCLTKTNSGKKCQTILWIKWKNWLLL